MNFDPNPLYYKMALYCHLHKNDPDKIIIFNQGSSRSSKTWDTFHLIYTYCDHNRGKEKEIYILRDSLANCKDYTLKEFQKCFSKIGIKSELFQPQKPVINLYGNKIYFRGLIEEEKSEAPPSDVIFVNEILDIESQSMISGWLMRCREMFIMDCNPKFTDHWAYNFENRPNCFTTHSTYKDNKHLEQSVINEIESLDPSNPVNVANGTADEYRYKVYMKGVKASPEGVVFPNIIWVDNFPEDIEHISYGLDFGTTAATAITKNGLKIIDGVNHLYRQKLFFEPVESSDTVIQIVKKLGINTHIWCDNNKPMWVSDMRKAGIRALLTRKFDGSRDYWINTLKRCKIYNVRDQEMRKEAENFRYRIVDGLTLSETIKKYDHLWSASGYAVVGDFRQLMKLNIKENSNDNQSND